ncbi:hypothetical protein HA397_30215 [Escherichia coli]|nr:hypothetical protein [Escherichia coli]
MIGNRGADSTATDDQGFDMGFHGGDSPALGLLITLMQQPARAGEISPTFRGGKATFVAYSIAGTT